MTQDVGVPTMTSRKQRRQKISLEVNLLFTNLLFTYSNSPFADKQDLREPIKKLNRKGHSHTYS